MDKTIKLYYARLANMGDLLNELVVSKVFDVQVERRSFLDGELSAIGSHLGMYTYHGGPLMRAQQLINGFRFPKVYIWGTGFIKYGEEKGHFFKRDMDFLAVRGELTRQRVEEMTGKSLDIPTADAGILAPMLMEKMPEKRYELGIIPHLCDLNDPQVQELLESYEGSVMINVKDEPLAVLDQIAQCKRILSSSLHGLIVADSLAVPNRHLVFGDRLKGDGYKFDDYYSAYGLKDPLIDLRERKAPSLWEIEDGWAVDPKQVEQKQQQLIDCFPRELLD